MTGGFSAVVGAGPATVRDTKSRPGLFPKGTRLSDERRCVTCPVLSPSREPRYVERPNVCEGDRLYLADLIAEIPGLVAQTTDKIHPEKISGEKVSGSRELPAPVNLTALGVTQPPYVRGPRSAPDLDIHVDARGNRDLGQIDDQLGIGNPAVILDQWIADWIDYPFCRSTFLPEPDVTSQTVWLGLWLDAACDSHPAIEEFAREIKDIVRKLRGIVQEVEKGDYVGLCPKKLRDGTRCNTRLYVDVYLTDMIKCRCGGEWNRRKGEWPTFAAEQDGWNEEAA
ncbi:MAG TPA: hypothetical protein VFR23_04215 [Jiangellaceae bacterium]|nr:hypothetical protein [Jiangellaceae bacterium]